MFPVAILAGGLAHRLRPITETIPKALVDVAGKPFIIRQLNYLHQQGINQVVLCVGYLEDMIQDVVGTGQRFGLNVSYSSDGSVLLGTGGALKKALPLLGQDFFILYGDTFLPINFAAIQKAYEISAKQGLMSILKNNDKWDKSNVCYANGMLLEYNKCAVHSGMNYIDYGLGIVSAAVFDQYPSDRPFDLADVYQDLSFHGHLEGFEVYERFYEIGSHTGLKEAEEYFLTKEKV